MQKHRIKDEIGALEEKLELLRAITSRDETAVVAKDGSPSFTEELAVIDALASLSDLDGVVHQQSLQKSIAASDFLARVMSVLAKEAHEMGYQVAISHFGEGRISLEMVEISMGAIVACLRASLKSYKDMTKAMRIKHRLFSIYSVYLEVRASADSVHFRLVDDGQGYTGSFRSELETEKVFHKIRSHIAKFGGWFSRKSLETIGGTVEFKVPLPQARFESVILQKDGFEVLVPTVCLGEIREKVASSDELATMGATVLEMDAGKGLVPVKEMRTDLPMAVNVGAADFNYWVICDRVQQKQRARRYPVGELVEPDSWFQHFGIFQLGTYAKVLPLLDGEALMKFHNLWGGGRENI